MGGVTLFRTRPLSRLDPVGKLTHWNPFSDRKRLRLKGEDVLSILIAGSHPHPNSLIFVHLPIPSWSERRDCHDDDNTDTDDFHRGWHTAEQDGPEGSEWRGRQ